MYEPDYTDSLRADILPSYSDSLMHHGIKGMHWGVRRYQNPDGSYTDAGKARRNEGFSLNPIQIIKQKKEERQKKKEEKRHYIEMANHEVALSSDFEKTKQGARLKKIHDKAEEDYMLNEDYDMEPIYAKAFKKAEHDFLYNTGKYVGNGMVDKYGEDEFKKFLLRYNTRYNSTGEQFIHEYAEDYVSIHRA